MATFTAPLPPNRSTGDAVPPAADVNALKAAISQLQAAQPQTAIEVATTAKGLAPGSIVTGVSISGHTATLAVSVPALEPFAADSVWKLGVSTEVVFAGTADARNTGMHNTGADGSGSVWVNSYQYSHPIFFAAKTDPDAAMTDSSHAVGDIPSGGTWQERIPITARIAAGYDQHMHVITPDGLTVLEHFGTGKTSNTVYSCSRRAVVNLLGSGIGPQNGVRAWGGSAIGGLIRSWEVDPTHPLYTGVIAHALAMALRPDQLSFDSANWTDGYGYYSAGVTDGTHRTGWPDGTPARGFMKQTGYVWPATEQDYDSPNSYTGTVPMGSYFAIPATVDITTLGLTTSQGLTLATAAQNYGAYVTDRSGTQAWYCEDDNGGPAGVFADALRGGGSYSAHDARVVFNALRVVSNNGPATPNGGRLNSSRRG